MNSLHCFLHNWLYPNGETLATWVLAAFALIPLLALLLSINEGRRGKQDKKRADQFERLKWMDSRFNSPAMLVARSALGKMMTKNPDLSTILRMPKEPAWMPIYFFTQIAQMWKKNLLALEDIAIAYGDYITIMWVEFGKFLKDDNLKDKFKFLEALADRLAKTDIEFGLKPYPSGLSPADLDFVKADFWKREAALNNTTT